MIKIVKANELEGEWFEGRSFGTTNETVHSIIEDVAANGDSALKKYGQKFDVSASETFLIEEKELKAAAEKLEKQNPEIYNAICYSHELALKFALRQKSSFDDFEIELTPGMFTGQKTIPVERAGVYVPAGRFPLVSTVVMTVTPAIAAGVKEIVLCTPPRIHPEDKASAQKMGLGESGKPFVGGKPYADEGIMAAAYICGVKKCYACGGAQAIAAMAYGTETIPAVDVIVGPGNKFVAAAKKVSGEIENQLEKLSTKEIARQSIDNCGRIIICDDLEQAAELANLKAPEHLELAMEAGALRDKIQSLVHNFGSLFIGDYAAEVFGDYAAGLNHTLPTSGSARFTGGLSVRVFLKTVTTLRAEKDSEGLKKSATAAGFLGDAEGLAAHAHAARIRLGE